MKPVIMLFIAAVVFATACSSAPADRSSIDSALEGLRRNAAGENISIDGMFYPNSAYFNGAFSTGDKLLSALKSDFGGAKSAKAALKCTGSQPHQMITVTQWTFADGSVKYLVIGWLRMRGQWSALSACAGDAAETTDSAAALSAFQTTQNTRKLDRITGAFAEGDICVVRATNTLFGRADAEQAFAYMTRVAWQDASGLVQGFSLGKEYLCAVGILYAVPNPAAKFPVLYVWRQTDAGPKIVMNFEYN